MGSNTIGAVGVSLPAPQALYPTLTPAQQVAIGASNEISLPPGGDFLVPSGTWAVRPGLYSKLQWLDPVTNTWGPFPTTWQNGSITHLSSDGVNYRIWNPTGFPIGMAINAAGTGYTTVAPTVTVSGTQGSTWLAIVGGGISAINFTNSGSGYAVAPLINIAAPATPGVQATAVCTINSAGGVVTTTIVNPGAGYLPGSPPLVTITPQQSDLNVGPSATNPTALTPAKATAQTSYVGGVTAVLLLNEGNNSQTGVPGVTFAGGVGTGTTATTIMDLTVTAVTITAAGSNLGNPTQVTTYGGWMTSAAAASNSPFISTQLLMPRNLVAYSSAPVGALNTVVILDGGEFPNIPTAYAFPVIASATSAPAVLGVTMGGVNDTVMVTPL